MPARGQKRGDAVPSVVAHVLLLVARGVCNELPLRAGEERELGRGARRPLRRACTVMLKLCRGHSAEAVLELGEGWVRCAGNV